ncbi:D-glycerate dehydrogenase [Terribacillus saccharophilus]|uniref:2-hydroxyacid dehydrogenase n=1 Tax=Terribacillus saccharophilus TaxID=361277 RepID=UPI003981B6BC
MKPKVVVYKKVKPEVKEMLGKVCEPVFFESPDYAADPQFWSELSEAEGLMGSSLKIDKELLDKATKLKVVANTSVGYDNFNLSDINEREIYATNTPDVLTDTTADTIFSLLLATARRIPQMNDYVKRGNWENKIEESLFGIDVHHKVLGIIGMGRIGSAIAKRAHHGFDMEILYHNRSKNELAEQEYDARYCELDELLSKSDYVCVMSPFTEETKHSIGKRELDLMKKTGILIVGSRGGIVREDDLYEALQSGSIRAAGMDVFETEPVENNNPLLTCENVVTLPHIGSATVETRTKMDVLAATNVIAALQGETPPSLVNREVFGSKA